MNQCSEIYHGPNILANLVLLLNWHHSNLENTTSHDRKSVHRIDSMGIVRKSQVLRAIRTSPHENVPTKRPYRPCQIVPRVMITLKLCIMLMVYPSDLLKDIIPKFLVVSVPGVKIYHLVTPKVRCYGTFLLGPPECTGKMNSRAPPKGHQKRRQ